MRASDTLRRQLEAAVATANQRPDTLDTFIAWQSTMQPQLQTRHTVSSAQSTVGVWAGSAGAGVGAGGGTMSGRGSLGGSDAVRAGLLVEVEALREMLDVLRWVGLWRHRLVGAGGCCVLFGCLPATAKTVGRLHEMHLFGVP
jgi:hypothetical protein